MDEVWRLGRMGSAIKIATIVEGKTEKAFKPVLHDFLKTRLAGNMPKLDVVPYDGRIPTGNKLKRVVERLLNDRKHPADAVIALTDVLREHILRISSRRTTRRGRCETGSGRKIASIRT